MPVFNEGDWPLAHTSPTSPLPKPHITLIVSEDATRQELAEEYKKFEAPQLAKHLRAVADALKERAAQDGVKIRGVYVDILNVLDQTVHPPSIPVPFPTAGKALSQADAEAYTLQDNLAIQVMIEANNKRKEQEAEEREARFYANEKRKLTIQEFAEELKTEVNRLENALRDANERAERNAKKVQEEKSMYSKLRSLFLSRWSK